jgi:hypothetical protein
MPSGWWALLLFLGGALTAVSGFIGPLKLARKLSAELVSFALSHTMVIRKLKHSVDDLTETVGKLSDKIDNLTSLLESK